MAKQSVAESYIYGDERVEKMNYFLYEISTYKVTDNCIGIINSKFFTSKKELQVKEITTMEFKDYSIVVYIDLLGVPETFINENNLKKK